VALSYYLFGDAGAGGPNRVALTVAASGAPTSALVPWNSCGAYMAATLGVATFRYLPYAIFNVASPLLTIAMAYTGIRVLRSREAQGHGSAR
jgi:NhaC family Na+:H+ antiporter